VNAVTPSLRSDRRTVEGRAAAPRGDRVQVTLQLDASLLERLDAAARRSATSRVALVSVWLDERLSQEVAPP
jgi:hypothetical protein